MMQFKDARGLVVNRATVINGAFKKPITCPYCDNYIEPVPVESSRLPYDAKSAALLVSYRCPACDKRFIGIYVLNGDDADYLSMVPIANEEMISRVFEKISPRFVAIHQQAFRAEARGDTEISIVGYRTAIEILLKDYAVGMLGRPVEEVIRKGLRQTIGDYAPDDISAAADVVRIIGDDYTHYVNSHPDVEFGEFKNYYSMLLSFIEYRYKLENPPVKR